MTQLFFISPGGYAVVHQAISHLLVPPSQSHAWVADGEVQAVGVVEMTDRCDTEAIASALEAAGVTVLPDHRTNEPIAPEHHALIKHHGVSHTDTTKQAMHKIHALAGFPPLKPKRFS